MSGVSPAPNHLKDRLNPCFGKRVHEVMQFLTRRAHAASVEGQVDRPPGAEQP